MRRNSCLACLYIVLRVVLPLWGQEEQEQTPALLNESEISVQLTGSTEDGEDLAGSGQEGENSGELISLSLYLRIFLILGFLIVLIYFTLKFLRRLSFQKPTGSGSGIQLHNSQVLHGDQMLHLVEVGGECYLLGTGGVQLLDHYRDPEQRDRVLLEASAQAATSGAAPSSVGARDFLLLLRSRLKPEKNSGGAGGKTSQHSAAEDLVVLQRGKEYRERLRSAAQALGSGQKPASQRQVSQSEQKETVQ